MNRQLADSHRPTVYEQSNLIGAWAVDCTCDDWRDYAYQTKDAALAAHARHVEREMQKHSE